MNEITPENEAVKEILRLQEQGHSFHCASGMVWFQHECECKIEREVNDGKS
jgi:hypothetical protein